ncbi:hypothetical protein KR018_007782 [Drosophila ironensis]|nr:hypothetical protein KR018_007782 [Drosophila ironensis]
MSKAVSFRKEVETPAEAAKVSPAMDRKFEQEPEIATGAEQRDELMEKTEGVAAEGEKDLDKVAKQKHNVFSVLQHNSGLGDGPGTDLESASSFTSCISNEITRDSILCRGRNESSGSLVSNCDIDAYTPSVTTLTPQTSIEVLWERRPMCLTPNCSESDCHASLEVFFESFPHVFTREEICSAFAAFNEVDEDRDGEICMTELKRLLEKLNVPQTHLATKKLMAQVVGSPYGGITFWQMMFIYGTLSQKNISNANDWESSLEGPQESVDVSQTYRLAH